MTTAPKIESSDLTIRKDSEAAFVDDKTFYDQDNVF